MCFHILNLYTKKYPLVSLNLISRNCNSVPLILWRVCLVARLSIKVKRETKFYAYTLTQVYRQCETILHTKEVPEHNCNNIIAVTQVYGQYATILHRKEVQEHNCNNIIEF